MIKLKQAVLVEGKYDANALAQVVDAPIFQTDGFGIMKNKELLSFLRRVAKERGLIILTDSDGAGFVIRSYLSGALPKEGVYHAYIPEISGKERRKRAPGKEGLLGVEGMRPEIILKALERSGVPLHEAPPGEEITKADFCRCGFSGGAGSLERRKALARSLDLPEKMSANALLRAVNLLYQREAFLKEYDHD